MPPIALQTSLPGLDCDISPKYSRDDYDRRSNNREFSVSAAAAPYPAPSAGSDGSVLPWWDPEDDTDAWSRDNNGGKQAMMHSGRAAALAAAAPPAPALGQLPHLPLKLQLLAPPHLPAPCPWAEPSALGPQRAQHAGRKTLILDLDETLVHSSIGLPPVSGDADHVIPVMDGSRHSTVYVTRRPGLARFLATLGRVYEVVVFTASAASYAAPLLDAIDATGAVAWRLYRDACTPCKGALVKDLSLLGRDLASTLILDDSPAAYQWHPANALPVVPFAGDPRDRALSALLPLLLDLATATGDVRTLLAPLRASAAAPATAAAT